MLEGILANYIGVPITEIQRLTQLSVEQILQDKVYISWLKSLDLDYLIETLPNVRASYEQHLPEFREKLESNYRLENNPMSAYTLANWLLGYLRYPQSLPELVKIHRKIPTNAIRETSPELLQMLDYMGEGQAMWQKALAVFLIPLETSNR